MEFASITSDQYFALKKKFDEGKVVSVLGHDFYIQSISANNSYNDRPQFLFDVELDVCYLKPSNTFPTKESEEEKQLKQSITLTELDIQHKQLMLNKYSAKLNELKSKREGNV